MSLRSRATMQFSVSVPPRLVEHPLPVVLGIPVQDTGYFSVEPSYMMRYITWHCCGPPGQYPWSRISACYFRVASLTRLHGPYQSMTAPSLPRRMKVLSNGSAGYGVDAQAVGVRLTARTQPSTPARTSRVRFMRHILPWEFDLARIPRGGAAKPARRELSTCRADEEHRGPGT